LIQQHGSISFVYIYLEIIYILLLMQLAAKMLILAEDFKAIGPASLN